MACFGGYNRACGKKFPGGFAARRTFFMAGQDNEPDVPRRTKSNDPLLPGLGAEWAGFFCSHKLWYVFRLLLLQ
jgi:hypothetical protein